MKLSDLFTFGKYKGKILKQVLEQENAAYVVWCIKNIPNFSIEEPYQTRLLAKYERLLARERSQNNNDGMVFDRGMAMEEVSEADFINR